MLEQGPEIQMPGGEVWILITGSTTLYCKRPCYVSHCFMLFTTGLQFALEPANRLQQPAPAASFRGSCRIRLATVSCIKLYWLSCRCATSGMTAAVLLFVPSLNILIKQICFVFNETHDSKRICCEDQAAASGVSPLITVQPCKVGCKVYRLCTVLWPSESKRFRNKR